MTTKLPHSIIAETENVVNVILSLICNKTVVRVSPQFGKANSQYCTTRNIGAFRQILFPAFL